ncbi:MAG TPA: VCBS repeat-containing protein [Phycisphaerae bacterium]|mgnify:CR=1 FL=1|nr:VCBS repeat-containing protein [Phycisphaerae bacterium]HOJ72988.1 VCBS repeat-containing protein [Phycisphaerae bacterium]HOM50172.1 VCBS repeat-containing protein [Phycisphaerae bacterium]HON67334.1 VCBS repeat-containing protein [Phycisphaerae bacterium]HOQ84309.1 VCBS repeat-containing protein [Phycisphaerae bacterium]
MSIKTFRWTWLLVAPGLCYAAQMAPNMPRKSTAPPKEVPAPPSIKWEKHQLSDHLNEGIAVFDVNNDGKLDITAGPEWYAAPDFKPRPVRKMDQVLNKEFADSNGEHAFDVNGDGWTDIISGSWFSDKIYWYENPGKEGLEKGVLWKQHLIAEGQNCCEGTLLLDLDGRGAPEIIVNSWDRDKPMTVIRMRPGKEPRFTVVHLGGPGTGHGIAVGDINGDKKPDILVPKGWFEQPARRPFRTPWKFHSMPISLDHSSLPGLILDLTGDGKNDIIMGKGHDYGIIWLEQGPAENGEPTWIKHEIDNSFSQSHCLTWADLDGDGKFEMITGKRWRGHGDGDPGSAEPMCLFRFIWDPASRTFTRDTISFDDGVGTGMQIRTADLDGDGRLDIAVAGKTGAYILFNRGKAN